MLWGLRSTVPFLFLLAVATAPARAQYGYPVGYGGYGWSGWGSSTVQGDVARGLGTLAAGAGTFREQSAVAAQINANTVGQINQYLYLSQQEANRRHREKQVRTQQKKNLTAEAIYRRLHDNPTPADIASGDALNVVLDELNNPKVYTKVLQGARTPLPGTLIRDIPFQSAANAITVSVDELTKKGAPPAIKNNPAFDKERLAARKTVEALRAEQEEKGEYNPETLRRLQDQIKDLWSKVDATLPRNSPDRREAEKFLKAAYGLSKMLETPAIDVLLAGVEKRPDTTLGDLLNFMKAFNLRFGAAKDARQRTVYNQLYPMLVRLRDETLPAGTRPPAVESSPGLQAAPGEFFQGMEFRQLDAGKTPPPAPGRPK